MQSQEEKLSLFVKAIGDYAEKQRLRILYDMDERSSEELGRAEKEALSDAYRLIQRETADMRTSISRELASRELAARRRLFEYRAGLENKIFEQAAERLCAFTKSDDYKAYMVRAAKTAREEFSAAPADTVFRIREADSVMEPAIREAYGGECAFRYDSSIQLGGVLAVNERLGRAIDVTLDSRLEDQREWFSATAELLISAQN